MEDFFILAKRQSSLNLDQGQFAPRLTRNYDESKMQF